MNTPNIQPGIYLVSENKPAVGDEHSFIFMDITGNTLYRLDAMGGSADLLCNVAAKHEMIFAQSLKPGLYAINPIGRQAGSAA